jgi:hypothetical protein
MDSCRKKDLQGCVLIAGIGLIIASSAVIDTHTAIHGYNPLLIIVGLILLGTGTHAYYRSFAGTIISERRLQIRFGPNIDNEISFSGIRMRKVRVLIYFDQDSRYYSGSLTVAANGSVLLRRIRSSWYNTRSRSYAPIAVDVCLGGEPDEKGSDVVLHLQLADDQGTKEAGEAVVYVLEPC